MLFSSNQVPFVAVWAHPRWFLVSWFIKMLNEDVLRHVAPLPLWLYCPKKYDRIALMARGDRSAFV